MVQEDPGRAYKRDLDVVDIIDPESEPVAEN